MTLNRPRRTAFAAAMAIAVAAVLTGCSEPPSAAKDRRPDGGCPADGAKPLTLVVGARMGSPRPSLPAEITALIESAAWNDQKVQVIGVDGQPAVTLAADVRLTSKNETKRKDEVAAVVRRIGEFVAKIHPKEPEADVLEALSEAARVTPEGGTVVLVDSGVATTGKLTFKDKDMFRAEPADVAEYLNVQQLLPRLTGRSVLLVGVGGTAEPQPALDENLRNRVVKLWQTVAEKAGAVCAAEMPIASRREAFETSVPVSIVELPVQEPVIKDCEVTVLPDSDSVGFVANTADLRDGTAAKRTLSQLAGKVAKGTQRLTLVGNTASVGLPAGNQELSRRRAETVKAILVGLGVADDRISTRGDGNTGKYHENDRGPKGELLPAPAARNRSVVVEVSCAG